MTLAREDAKARAGQEGEKKFKKKKKRERKRKVVTSRWKVIIDWLCLICAFPLSLSPFTSSTF